MKSAKAVITIGIVAIAVAVAATIGNCGVKSRLESAVASGATSFDFAADPKFEWDRMFIFGAYTPREEVEKSLGFAWADFKHSAVQVQDENTLVVFVRDRNVVDWFDATGEIKLGWIANPKGYSRAESTFRVDRTSGWPELRPVEEATTRPGDS